MTGRVELVVVNDNEPGPGLYNDWGWSLYVKAHNREVLFDADTKYTVIEYNARALGIDLSRLDFAVLSHWHRDHYGGFPAVAMARKGLTIYTPPGPLPRLARLGLEPIPVDKTLHMDGYTIMEPFYVGGLDLYELGLIVESPKGPVLVVGCSHPGIDNIVRKAASIAGDKLFMVIGGFHNPPADAIDTVAELVEGPICASHCSGDDAKRYIRSRYPGKSCSVRTGSKITITGA